MNILPSIHLVGSGRDGFGISDPFDCAVWLLNGGDELALIDTGFGRDIGPVLAEIQRDGLDPALITKILLTHTHIDHAGGAAAWREHTGAKVYVSQVGAWQLRTGDEDALGLSIARRLSSFPKEYRFIPCPVDVELHDDTIVSVGDFTLRTLTTPGHSKDSICYYGHIDDRNVLWCGDVVQFGDAGQFKGLISLLHLPGCDIHDYAAGVKKLGNLEVDALLPGHRLFCLRQGQQQIDAVRSAFEGVALPRSVLAAY